MINFVSVPNIINQTKALLPFLINYFVLDKIILPLNSKEKYGKL